jgi:hypothetical protein
MNLQSAALMLMIAAGASGLAGPAVATDSCARSRDYLLGGLAGELPQGAQAYKQLFNTCIATAELANVKDAYILKDGGIGAVARNNSIAATAATLSDFCQRFPRATLRFISQKELSRAATISRTVALSSGGITSCRKIRGLES